MSTKRRARTTPEWVVFAIATGIILALAGAIGWLWTQPYDPARVTVQAVAPPRVEGRQSYISAEVTNHGDETAEAVQVHAAMTVDGVVLAEGDQTVDFLSGGKTEEVVFVFTDLATNAEIELSIASFKVP